jgi:peptide/nickel transport system ATP-binding protein
MARRVLVSTAVIGNARLIIADEPTPGMAAETARTAMGHFRELAGEGAGVLLITHDLDLAFEYADRIAVFYAGTTLEIAQAEDFKRGENALRHPYSKALWRAIPQNGFSPTPGTQPYGAELSQTCLYSPRCSSRTEDCNRKMLMRELRGGEVRCVNAV